MVASQFGSCRNPGDNREVDVRYPEHKWQSGGHLERKRLLDLEPRYVRFIGADSRGQGEEGRGPVVGAAASLGIAFDRDSSSAVIVGGARPITSELDHGSLMGGRSNARAAARARQRRALRHD